MSDEEQAKSAPDLRLTAQERSLAASGVKVDPDKVFTLELRRPIPFGKETIMELVFQPLRGKHLRQVPVDQLRLGHGLDLAGRLTGQPPRVLDELGAEDIARVNEVIAVFMEPFQGTG